MHRNPNLNRAMMARHFLRALARINLTTPVSSSMKRCRRIKRAAYASMAYAAGRRRAWSQALFRRIRDRARLHIPMSRRVASRRKTRSSGFQPREPSQTDVLRSLVPGGKSMDLCSLLEETADYVQSLSTQVSLMQAVADSLTA